MEKKEIRLSKSGQHITVGGLRLTPELFKKIEKFAKENNVSNQEIIRAILETYISEVKFV